MNYKEEEKIDPLEEKCIKALNIYTNIVNFNLNINKISDDSITPVFSNKENYKLNHFIQSAIALKQKKSKSNKIKRLSQETIDFKDEIETILERINAENNRIVFYNLYKLECLYYLYNYINSDTNSGVVVDYIEENISMCIWDNKLYYNILSLLGNIEPENNKKIKLKNYFAKIRYLDPFLFNNRVHSFLYSKAVDYEQYTIVLPNLENNEGQNISVIKENLNQIETALNILKETETFQCHERFYYFRKYKNKDKFVLEIINNILKIKKKSILVSLDEYTIDLAEEEIEYFKASLQKKNEEFIDIMKINNEKEKELENFKLDNAKLQEESNKIKEEAIRLQNKLNDKEKLYKTKLDEIKSLNGKIQVNVNETKLLISQIDSAKLDLKNEKDKIKGIQRRDINSKIFEYFYFSVPENLRIAKEKEKEKKTKKKLSNAQKIELILNNMQTNYPNYFEHIKSKKIDLKDFLFSLIKENRSYNSIAHYNLSPNEFLNSSDSTISVVVQFLLKSSVLFSKYIFNFDEEVEDLNETNTQSQASILSIDILNDFIELEEKCSKSK